MSCLWALPALYASPGPVDPDPRDDVCLAFQVDAGARASRVTPDVGISSRIDLTRARLAVAVTQGPLRVAVRTSGVRSAGEGAYIGINGEAFVPEFDVALVGAVGWGGAAELEAGIVPDLWVNGGEQAWGFGGVLQPLGEAVGWMERADLGIQGGGTWFDGVVSARVAVTSGEGFAYRERNEGKDLAGEVRLSPIRSAPRALVLSAYGRQGSRGLAVARNHRAGARVAGEVARIGWGVEGLAAWGVDADATQTPLGASAWVRGQPWGPLVAMARADTWTAELGTSGAGARQLLGAVGVGHFGEPAGRGLLLLGVANSSQGAGVATLPGDGVFASGTTWFVHLDGVLRRDTE